jgi:hypothetical protein
MRYSRIKVRKRLALFFHVTRQSVQSSKALKLFRVPKSRSFQRPTQNGERIIVDMERHGKRMPIFAAVRKRKTRRIGKAAGCSVHDFCNESKRLQGSWTESLYKK